MLRETCCVVLCWFRSGQVICRSDVACERWRFLCLFSIDIHEPLARDVSEAGTHHSSRPSALKMEVGPGFGELAPTVVTYLYHTILASRLPRLLLINRQFDAYSPAGPWHAHCPNTETPTPHRQHVRQTQHRRAQRRHPPRIQWLATNQPVVRGREHSTASSDQRCADRPTQGRRGCHVL